MATTTRERPPNSVLYVDDEARSLRNFARLLGERFDVLTADSVDAAITILDDPDRCIAVLISDQRMPGRTGVDLLHYAREHHPQTVRILTTAYSDLDSAVEAVNQGEVWRYINKPWQPDALYNEIRQALTLFELRSERDQLVAEKQQTMRLMAANSRLQTLIAGLGGQLGLPWPWAALRDYLNHTSALNPASMIDGASGPIRPAEETRLLCGILDECGRFAGFRPNVSCDGSAVGAGDIETILQAACRDRNIMLEPIDDIAADDWKAAVGNEAVLRRLLDCLVAVAAACGQDNVCIRWTAERADKASELNFFLTPATPPPDLFIAQPVSKAPDEAAKRVGRCIALYVLADALSATLRIRSDNAQWLLSLSLPAQYPSSEHSVSDADIDTTEEIESIFEWFNSFLTR